MEFAKYIIYLIDAEIILIPRKFAFIRIIQFSKFLKINNRAIKNHLVRYLQRAQKEKKSILRVFGVRKRDQASLTTRPASKV